MNRTVRRTARGPARLGATLLLLGTFGLAGCEDPATGTVQVPAETHARLKPRDMVKGKLGPGAAGKAGDAKPADAKPADAKAADVKPDNKGG